MLILNPNGKICIKKLTDAEIGRSEKSHQVHIGLNGDIIQYDPNVPVEVDGYLLYDNMVEELPFMFKYIGDARSPLLQANVSSPAKCAYKRILDLVSGGTQDLLSRTKDWYISLTFNYEEKPVLLLFDDDSEDYALLNQENAISDKLKCFSAEHKEFYTLTKLFSSKTEANKLFRKKIQSKLEIEDILVSRQDNQRAFVHQTLDFIRNYGNLDALSKYLNVTNSGYFHFKKESEFWLKNMFIETNIDDIHIRNTQSTHVRWYEDSFSINKRECYLSVDWYRGKKGKDNSDNDLMVSHFSRLLNDIYDYQYRIIFNLTEGCYELWMTNANVMKNKKANYKDFEDKKPLQEITYGAPGTGKSYSYWLKESSGEYEMTRITFHPDTDYSNFVGCYKPVMSLRNGEKKIEYAFVKQPFLNTYIKAWNNPDLKFGLVIEEINRGNCAQIFGDIFQLLDRDEDGYSKYPIDIDEDIKNVLKESMPINYPEHFASHYKKELSCDYQMALPPNMSIFATMNTSDQSLFPIDSAFKRRWDWKYIKITDGVDSKTGQKLNWKIQLKDNAGSIVKIGDLEELLWWDFLKQINSIIASMTSSADKQLGYFFCKAKNGIIDTDTFVSKVVFYLWNDVFKDYAMDEGDLFKYKREENGKQIEDDLVFPSFFDEHGHVDAQVTAQFIQNVINWKKEEKNHTEE